MAAGYGGTPTMPHGDVARWVRSKGEASASMQLDLVKTGLPLIVAPTVAVADNAPMVAWKAEGDLSGADALYVVTGFGEPPDFVRWDFIVPPGASSPVTLPRLPDRVGWKLGKPWLQSVDAFDLDILDGYDKYRTAIGVMPPFDLRDDAFVLRISTGNPVAD